MSTDRVKRVARIGSILAGTGVLFLGGMLLASSPASADNGPHISTTGNMTVDRCAGCHRAHTAKASYLLLNSEISLCTTCHGASGTGATTDVVDGVAYNNTLTPPDVNRGATVTGALRGGGFTKALIASSTGVAKTSIGVLGAGANSSSGHSIDGTPQTAWGKGAINSGAGASVSLQCTSCHDPHGNGNYRILRPVPNGGEALPAVSSPVTITNMVKNATLSSGTTYYYDITTGSANTFAVTNPVTIVGSTTTGANGLIGATVKVVTDSTHLTISMRSVNVTTTVTDGTLGYAYPNAIANVTGSGTTATYTTWNVHGMLAGQTVTIKGVNGAADGTGYNVTGTIVSTPTTSSFTMANTTTTAYTSGGTIPGIPDALGTKVYTTSNYWAVDDHNYSGSYVASGTAPTAFIANISQWCSTCHTRYLAGSGAWDVDSGDSIYTYKHRSQNGKENSPNCIQCHVAHGSNAAMSGSNSASVKNPDGSTPTPADDSRLLRADNRGTCNMCHNM